MSTIKSHWSKSILALLFVLLTSGLAAGQTVTGTISGTVIDTTERAISWSHRYIRQCEDGRHADCNHK